MFLETRLPFSKRWNTFLMLFSSAVYQLRFLCLMFLWKFVMTLLKALFAVDTGNILSASNNEKTLNGS